MSPREKQFVQSAISDNQDIEQLLEMVTNDTSLSHSKKEAIICFITTFKASSEYWSNNYSEWLKLTDKATTRSFKFDWKQVAVADAYWAYTGLLSSWSQCMGWRRCRSRRFCSCLFKIDKLWTLK